MNLTHVDGNKVVPVYNNESRILILGSFPDVKARDTIGFCYANPRNRFWDVMTKLFGETFPKPDISHPENLDVLTALLNKHHIAIWNVIQSCDIHGALDNTIKSPEPNDLHIILDNAQINQIYTNGTVATTKYNKIIKNNENIKPKITLPTIQLPSTSPRNTRYSLECLVEAWKVILK